MLKIRKFDKIFAVSFLCKNNSSKFNHRFHKYVNIYIAYFIPKF